jgi:tripartite-type tricarboxylate transporter receptor subunit TctC
MSVSDFRKPLGRRLLFASAPALLLTSAAQAQEFPTKPIKFVVGFAPGGSADVMARILGQSLADRIGQPVITDNRAGAAGTIGADIVARSAPDGYTLLVGSVSNVVISATTMPVIPFVATTAFAPIVLTATIPLVLVINPSLPLSSIQELVKYAKANPNKLSFASGGQGVSNHLAGELFNRMAGVTITHVPYKGDGPGVASVVAGETQMMFATISTAMPQVQSGRLRAIGVTTAKRVSRMKDLPTIAEAALPGYEVNVWNGVLAPAATPATVVRKLNNEIVRTLNLPEVRSRLQDLGFEIVGSTPEEFGEIIRADMQKWPKIAKDAESR